MTYFIMYIGFVALMVGLDIVVHSRFRWGIIPVSMFFSAIITSVWWALD